jgi:acyl-CoA synthetase (AMP-forming)/AMP-acid ligase II
MYRDDRAPSTRGPVAQPTFPDYRPTIPGLLQAGRERYASNDCVVTPDQRITYAQLDDSSRRVAGLLVDAGVGKGSRVGVLFPNSVPWVVAWMAAARLGALAIPVNTFYQAPELAQFLRHADIQYLIGVGRFLHHDYLERIERICPEIAGAGPGPLHLRGLPQLRRVMLWGESDRAWAEGDFGRDDLRPSPAAAALVDGLGDDVSPGDELLVTYTSGSTGEPKGVVLGHGAVIRHCRNLAALSGIDETSRIWTSMPLCWVGGFSFSLLRAICVGGCFLTQEVMEAGAALRMLESERVTNVAAWPAATKSLIEHPDYPNTDLGSLRAGATFYDAMPPERRPPDAGLVVSSLGMSETCGPHTFWTPDEEVHGVPEAYRGAFGHEVPGTEHRIIDADTGADMPDGEEGEVLVRGYSLMLGLHRHERSEVFDADGWYRTGDRGFFRDGWFFFTGRQTDLIKTSGANVAPAEVERALMSFDEVKLAFVVGVPHPDRGQDVVALVVVWRGVEDGADVAALHQRLRGEVSAYKVPRHIFVISDDEVPWLISQKVDRRVVAALAEELVHRPVPVPGPAAHRSLPA